ncbi:MAG: recombination protein RecR [Candidatus Parcubacteria bacterium]|jgi:recombination protein RecR
MGPVHELTALLAHLPGLGPRQARRVVQYLLKKNQAFRNELSGLIAQLAEHTAECSLCHRYDDPHTSGTCAQCRSTSRDTSTLLVVEHDVDIDAVEASGAYAGRYFVLGGLMPLTERRRSHAAHAEHLVTRAKTEPIVEVVFALATTPEGDYTARELSKKLTEVNKNIKTTLLGRGLSVGAEVEYADPETLRNALKSRA